MQRVAPITRWQDQDPNPEMGRGSPRVAVDPGKTEPALEEFIRTKVRCPRPSEAASLPFSPLASSPTTHALIPAQQSFSSAGSQTTTPSACYQLGGSWLSEILVLDLNYPTDLSKKVAQSYGLGHLGLITPT
ncbi:hypothetical protein CGCF413_v013380 [Colletotrichum fructicola]|nr:hypothetical protein CGCF413_v013380 [Colletotrichum fructicola]